MSASFRQSKAYAMGLAAERRSIEVILQKLGYDGVQWCGGEEINGGAPLLFTAAGDDLPTPDIRAWRDGVARWFEIKAKTSATFREVTPGPRYEQGIDITKYDNYCRVEEMTGVPVSILVHQGYSRRGDFEARAGWYVIDLAFVRIVGEPRPAPYMDGERGVYWPVDSMKWVCT